MSLGLVILASGEGTNAAAIMDLASRQPQLLRVLALVSDRESSPALEKARSSGVHAQYISHAEPAKLLAFLSELRPDWACLAGYMRILGTAVVSFFYDPKLGHAKILNIHPSLLPDFPGLRAYEQAYAANVSESGVTVHIVDEGLDRGPIVMQRKFPRLPNDSFEEFRARGRALENNLYLEALQAVARGEYKFTPQKGLRHE
jgi:phosphoribosylglycinamide formyltransferase-1